MATITQVICDKCRSTNDVQTVDWEIARETGRIDLCPSCLGKALATVSATTKTRPRTAPPSEEVPPSQKEIRAWAKENGYAVPAKGRIPTEVLQAFTSRHHAAPSLESLGL